VVFGLSVSSSWGNGHATLWRGLIAALARNGHRVTFFECDAPWYRGARDLHALPGGELHIYDCWADVAETARRAVAEADAAIVTSFCPDVEAATALLLAHAPAARIYYDLDSPVTLERLDAGERVDYLPAAGLVGFDLVLSYAGGPILSEMERRLGAVRAEPLYGHVDPAVHAPGHARPEFAGALSYIGTYAADRQPAVDELFLQPARACPEARFVLAGSGYPDDFPWATNVFFVRHLPPADHPDFYASQRLTLNVTRAGMKRWGYAPSGRLFEAAACGAAIVTDRWPGLDRFFAPGEELLVAESAADVEAALARDDAELRRIADRARERVLAEHTSAHRAAELVELVRSIPARPEQRVAA
jgi:spore maturation protein CgeB